MLDSFGKLVANMDNIMASPTGTNYRIGQYDIFRNHAKVLYLQKNLVAVQALQSQISFLKSLDRNDVSNGISGLSQYLAKVNSSTNKRDLLTLESRVGYLYFRNYVKLFDPKYGFTRGVVAGLCDDDVKSHAAYAINNALLNYGYM